MQTKTLLSFAVLCALITGCEKKAGSLPPSTATEPLPPPTAEEITAAFDAAEGGDLTAVTAVLEQGMPADQRDEFGNTMLMLAAFNGHDEVIKTLLEAGAGVRHENNEGRTALMFASTGPFPATVRLLFETGADVNATDNVEHFTPVMFAASEGLSPIVDILIEAGADPTMTDTDGDTAADFARQRGFIALADKLQKLIDQKEAK